jgi:hypothetical protein
VYRERVGAVRRRAGREGAAAVGTDKQAAGKGTRYGDPGRPTGTVHAGKSVSDLRRIAKTPEAFSLGLLRRETAQLELSPCVLDVRGELTLDLASAPTCDRPQANGAVGSL